MRPTYIFVVILILFNNLLFLSPFEKLLKQNEFITLATAITLIVSFVLIKEFTPNLKKWYLFLVLLFTSLIIESIIFYGTLFIYPHVFSKITPLFLFFAVFAILKKYKIKIDLELISKLIFIFYFIDLFLLGWFRFFSPFQMYSVPPEFGAAGDSRVFHASLIFFFIIPLLFYQTKFINEGNKKNLFLFLISFLIILIQNHRSVWLASLVSLFINYILITSKSIINFSIIRKASFVFLLMFFVFGVVFYTLPNLAQEIILRFENAIFLEEGSTGAWRMEQVLSYIPLIGDKILFGLRFTGFEIDSPSITNSIFATSTGHHFHNGFLEILFYFGVVGFLLIFGFLAKILKDLYKNISKNYQNQFYISFALACIVFSFSYTLPHFIWGILAIGYYNLYHDQSIISS